MGDNIAKDAKSKTDEAKANKDEYKANNDEIKENILQLVRRAKDGEEDAIQALIEQYKPFIIKTCRKYTIPSYDFEDLIQYSYLSVLKSIKLYNFGKVHFTSYVMTAINNNLGDLLRKSVKIYREFQEEEGFTFDYEDESFRVEDDILEKESSEELREALETLSNDEREVIRDFYERRMPILAIAEAHGYSRNGIVKKKKRILKKLREEL